MVFFLSLTPIMWCFLPYIIVVIPAFIAFMIAYIDRRNKFAHIRGYFGIDGSHYFQKSLHKYLYYFLGSLISCYLLWLYPQWLQHKQINTFYFSRIILYTLNFFYFYCVYQFMKHAYKPFKLFYVCLTTKYRGMQLLIECAKKQNKHKWENIHSLNIKQQTKILDLGYS